MCILLSFYKIVTLRSAKQIKFSSEDYHIHIDWLYFAYQTESYILPLANRIDVMFG